MVNILISGPAHSKKGYIMVEIARILREHGCSVRLQGEETHLKDKLKLDEQVVSGALLGIDVTITELQTSQNEKLL